MKGRRLLRRLARCPRPLAGGVVATAAAFLAASPTAQAESNPPAQHLATAAAFLAQTPAADASPAAVCLIDSGVDLTPDLGQAVVGRESVTGTGPEDGSGHGTYVAGVAVAAANGWGTVGAWPAARVYAVRALRAGMSVFYAGDVAEAIDRCLRARADGKADIKVISISIGGPSSPSPAEVEAVAGARVRGVNVVASAGNSGAGVSSPGNIPGVFAVGAGQAGGSLCGFASRGPELDLLALGCGVEIADTASGAVLLGDGSSLSAPFVATVLAALREHRSDLSPDEAEGLLRSSARWVDGWPMLDAAAAFRAAGLGHLVDAYHPGPPHETGPERSGAGAPQSQRPAGALAPSADVATLRRCRRSRPSRTRWCVMPELAWSERVNHRRMRLALARVPRHARVRLLVDGRLVTRRLGRTITLPLRSRGYRVVTIQFTSGAKRSIPLRIGRSELEG